MNWEIIDVEPFERRTLKAFFTLSAGLFVIKKCTYHEANGKSWVGFPAAPRVTKEGLAVRSDDGKVVYNNLVAIPDHRRFSEFQEWCKPLVRAALERARSAAKVGSDDIPF
jgi:hypothetical protein